jgi:hypothetical protein
MVVMLVDSEHWWYIDGTFNISGNLMVVLMVIYWYDNNNGYIGDNG